MTTDSVEHEPIADRIVEVVTAHPCVVRMDGGEFGVVATYLPGRKVLGVRDSEDTLEICVVLGMRRPVPDVVAELREKVREITGPVPVDVTVADVLGPTEQQHYGTDP